MNQEKIGKFIAKKRKEKNMTQAELASKLNVTDRAVSHWENGRRLPDVSLFKSICEIFDISLSELMNGEMIDKDILKRTEENVIDTLNNNKINKKKMKIIIYSLCILLLIILFILFKSIYHKIDIEYFTINNSDVKELNKVFRYNNRNIYYYGIDNAMFCDKNDNCYSLKESIKKKQITFDKFKSYLDTELSRENLTKLMLYDGGTSIYKKGSYTVIFCNTINGNKDIYIGNDEMVNKLDGEYCGHDKSNNVNFTRTYKVLSSTIDKNDSEFYYAKLEQNNGNVGNVSINSTYTLIPGKTYEFTFMAYEDFDDTIENIFKYAVLLEVRETNRSKNEQINNEIYVNKDIGKSDIETLTDVDMKAINVKNGSLTVVITDHSKNEFIYGSSYRIDYERNGKWYYLSPKSELVFNSMAYHPDKNGKLTFDIDYTYGYGLLDKGKYRIVKDVIRRDDPCNEECKKYYVTAEFIID